MENAATVLWGLAALLAVPGTLVMAFDSDIWDLRIARGVSLFGVALGAPASVLSCIYIQPGWVAYGLVGFAGFVLASIAYGMVIWIHHKMAESRQEP